MLGDFGRSEVAESAKVLVISSEAQAGVIWHEAFARSGLSVRLTVATSGEDGMSAMENDLPESVVLIDDNALAEPVTHSIVGVGDDRAIRSFNSDQATEFVIEVACFPASHGSG